MNAFTSYLPTYLPSDRELDECMWLSLTSDQPWEPYDEVLNESEKEAREKRELSCSAITTIEKNSITITMLNDHILKLVKSSNQQSIITHYTLTIEI